MAKSDKLRKAKKNKNDEFYTKLEDIEAEISNHQDYVKHFEDKIVFCNCDDPQYSNFFEFFKLHYKQLKIKKLITTHFNKDGSPSYKLEWFGEMKDNEPINMIKSPLDGNGDFRSEECIEILKEADIVVTNPPFSLFREFVSQLIEYNKKFIIIGSKAAIGNKDFFPLLKEGRCFLGYNEGKGTMSFSNEVKGDTFVSVPAYWYTNLDIDKNHEPLILTKNYNGNEENYPSYYNYDAIDVKSVKSIPKDYMGEMGVPITFLADYCKEQFELIGLGSEVQKTKNHIARKEKDTICYEVNGIPVWTTSYTEYERKVGNSLRVERNGLPDKVSFSRIIIKRRVGEFQ